MKPFRICFYVFDLVMFLVFFGCLRHCMWFESTWEVVSMHILLLLRLAIPYLMYRRYWWSIIPMVVSTVLFVPFMGGDAFKNTIYNMGLFPSVVLNCPELLQGEHFWLDMTNGEFLVWLIVAWTWVVPYLAYAVWQVRRREP